MAAGRFAAEAGICALYGESPKWTAPPLSLTSSHKTRHQQGGGVLLLGISGSRKLAERLASIA